MAELQPLPRGVITAAEPRLQCLRPMFGDTITPVQWEHHTRCTNGLQSRAKAYRRVSMSTNSHMVCERAIGVA